MSDLGGFSSKEFGASDIYYKTKVNMYRVMKSTARFRTQIVKDYPKNWTRKFVIDMYSRVSKLSVD